MKTLRLLKIIMILNIALTSKTFAVKGMYVDFFGAGILAIDADGTVDYERQIKLLEYCQSHGYDYICMFSMQGYIFDRCDPQTSVPYETVLADFISLAKTTYGITKVGISVGQFSTSSCGTTINQAPHNIDAYNSRHTSNECIDVIQLEEDFYLNGLANWTGRYMPTLDDMWTLKTNTLNHPLLIEVYVSGLIDFGGGNNQQFEADFIDEHADRVLIEDYFNGNWIRPFSTSYFFEKDANDGKRFEMFANSATGHTKNTQVMVLFSAESDVTNVRTNFFGDYLNYVDNGYSWIETTITKKYDDAYFGIVPPEQMAFNEFMNVYDLKTDPYDDGTYPCGNNTSTIKACTDIANHTYGNTIIGVMWHKYGMLPGTNLYVFDYDSPLNWPTNVPFTFVPKERVTNAGAAAAGEIATLSFHTTASPTLDNFQWDSNSWYKWNSDGVGGYMFERISGETNDTYTNSPVSAVGATDRYLHGKITNLTPPYFFNYEIRNEEDVFGLVPNGNDAAATITNISLPGCPNFNNGSITVAGWDHDYCSPCSMGYIKYRINNGNFIDLGLQNIPYQITGLSSGTIEVELAFDPQYTNFTAYITTQIEELDNLPRPDVFSGNRYSTCNPNLETYEYVSYQWNDQNGSINGATNQTYQASQDGDYSVTVTDFQGCSNTSDIFHLKVIPDVLITGANSTCGSQTYSVPTSLNNISYEWTVPTGATYTQTANSIVVNWGTLQYTGGTISCKITNICGNFAIGNVDVPGCCNSAGYTQKNNAIESSTVTYCGQKININGIYKIDNGATVTFDNCEIQFSNNSSIEIQQGCTLNIISACTNANNIARSHLYACDNVWTGIHINGNASKLIIDNALIEDAQNAIFTHNGGTFNIINSDFNNNTVSIFATDHNYASCVVTANTFDCSSCNGNTGSIFHIRLINSDQLTILRNSFKNCSIGIKSSDKSSTYVESNTFQDIGRAGVWAENNGSIDVTNNNSFNKCNGGVVASNSVAVYVDNNSFSDGAIAVVVQSCMNRKININNNTIVNPSFIGIAGMFNYPSQQHYTNNTISFSPNQLNFGIAVGESNLVQPGLTNALEISNNHIYDAATGIEVANDYDAVISENDIHIINSNSNPVFGILAEESHYPQIIENTIRDESIIDELQFGIVVELGGGAIVCSNDVDALEQGIVFGGNMLGTNVQVKFNVMENNSIGFVLRNGGDIGEQGGHGIYYYNQWINNIYDSYSFGSNISNTSHFPVFTSSNFVPYIISTHDNDGQNGAYDILSPVSNVISQYIATCTGTTKDPTDDAKLVTNDQLTYLVDSEETRWISKNVVLDAIKYKNDIDSTDQDIQNFEALADNEAMGQLRSLKEDYQSAFADTNIAGGDSIILQQVESSNAQISDQTSLETYLKTVNDIFLKTAAINNNNFTSQQTATLQFIAQLCPYEGGPAVYTARLLLRYNEGVCYTSNNCNTYTPMRFAQSKHTENSFSAFPNPTISMITFNYLVKDESLDYFVRIWDNIGKEWMFEKLNSKSTSTTLDVGNLSPGIYQYEMLENTRQIFVGKISIIR